MPRTGRYWLHPEMDGPYASFLNIIQSYLHPDSLDPKGLRELAQHTELAEWVKFKSDFREVIADPMVLPEDALFRAAGYDDGSDEAFLARVWHELYGDESPTADPRTGPSPES